MKKRCLRSRLDLGKRFVLQRLATGRWCTSGWPWRLLHPQKALSRYKLAEKKSDSSTWKETVRRFVQSQSLPIFVRIPSSTWNHLVMFYQPTSDPCVCVVLRLHLMVQKENMPWNQWGRQFHASLTLCFFFPSLTEDTLIDRPLIVISRYSVIAWWCQKKKADEKRWSDNSTLDS